MKTPSYTMKSSMQSLTQFLTLSLLALAGAFLPAQGATWYLQRIGPHDWNALSDWNSLPFGGGTSPTSISSADTFDVNGYQVFTPIVSSGTPTFGGNQLVLHGGSAGMIAVKTLGTGQVVIGNLVSYGGFIAGNDIGIPVSITTFTNNANTTISDKKGASNAGTNFTIGTLTGPGDISAIGYGAGAVGGRIQFNITNATGFTGIFYIANGSQFTFNTPMTSGGPLDVGGAGTAVILNSTVTFKGLTINGVDKPVGTYTAASLGAPFSGTGSVVVQTAVASNPPVTQMYGVNFSGGESTNKNYPTKAYYWDYYHGKNLNLIRVPFRWEYVQPTLNGPLDSAALTSLDTVVSLAAARGMSVILDMHNFGHRTVSGTSYLIGSTQVPNAAFQNAWQQLAAHFNGSAGIYGYDIMNEPHDDAGTWVSTTAQYGINGVRSGDTTHNIVVEASAYSAAASWMGNGSFNVTDPSNKLVFSAHTYWDSDNSGTYAGTYDSNNVYPNIGVDKAASFIYWLGLKGAKGHIGEFGVPNNVASPDPRWNVALDNFLNYLDLNGVPATYWGTYNLSNTYALRPNTDNGTVCFDAPAMSILQNYGGGGGVTPFVTGQTLGGSLVNNYTGWKGMQITTGTSPVTVKQLGRWVVAGNTGTHTIELVNGTTHAVLGSVTVNTSGTPAGAFVYGNLSSPVTLAASTIYYVASSETNGGDQSYNDVGTVLTTTGVAAINRGIYSPDNITWNIHGSGSVSYGPLSFGY